MWHDLGARPMRIRDVRWAQWVEARAAEPARQGGLFSMVTTSDAVEVRDPDPGQPVPRRQGGPSGSGWRIGTAATPVPVHAAGGLGCGGVRVSVVHAVAGAASRVRFKVLSAVSPRRSVTASGFSAPGSGGSSRTVRLAQPRRRSWRVFLVVGAVVLLVSFLLGQRWQGQIRDLMAAEPEGLGSKMLSPVMAVLVFVGLVAAGRGIRRFFRWVAGRLSRWMGQRAARALGWVLAAALTVGLVSGVVVDGVIARDQPDLLGAGRHDQRRRGPADQPAAVGWAGFAGRLGHPRLPGPQLRRAGPHRR